MRSAVAPALLLLAAALALASPPAAAAPLSPVLTSLSSLAGDAAVAALQADARAATIALAGVHDASMVVSGLWWNG